MNSHYQAAATRGSLYKLIADFLSYPSDSLQSGCQSGEVDEYTATLIDKLPYTLSKPHFKGCDGGDINMESEYLRLFELPVDGPPCPLYGGVHGGNRQKIMEELLRLYRYFGLSTEKASSKDLPDSIPTVLEFLYFLTFKESATTDPEGASGVRMAQRDLLERHLTHWLPSIITQLEKKNPLPFYCNTMELLNKFTLSELEKLATP